jgi:hypothetical protein
MRDGTVSDVSNAAFGGLAARGGCLCGWGTDDFGPDLVEDALVLVAKDDMVAARDPSRARWAVGKRRDARPRAIGSEVFLAHAVTPFA